jgi:hypothetical protein
LGKPHTYKLAFLIESELGRASETCLSSKQNIKFIFILKNIAKHQMQKNYLL